jgi:hypothetical protein
MITASERAETVHAVTGTGTTLPYLISNNRRVEGIQYVYAKTEEHKSEQVITIMGEYDLQAFTDKAALYTA